MTLTQTLQIQEQFLQFEDLQAMAYCEKRWQQEGSPATKFEMVNFIERMLQELQHNGVGYPKVLLLRKKEIQRGVFKLETREPRNEPGRLQNLAGDVCPECRGRGFFDQPGGDGTLCMACLGRRRRD
jgi:hypothetical protein